MGPGNGGMFIALEGFVSQKSLTNVRIFLAWSKASNHPIPWVTYITEAPVPWCKEMGDGEWDPSRTAVAVAVHL